MRAICNLLVLTAADGTHEGFVDTFRIAAVNETSQAPV
jgi:hypothetical protein